MFSVKYHVHRYILYFSSFSSHFLIIYIIVCVYNRRPSERIFIFDPLILPPFTPFKSTVSRVFHTMYVVYHVLTHSREQKSIASYHLPWFLSLSLSHDAAVKSLTGIISMSQRVKTTVSTTYCIVILEFSTVARGTVEPRALGSEYFCPCSARKMQPECASMCRLSAI